MSNVARSWHAPAEALLLPTGALTAALLLFGLFVWFGGHSPVAVWVLLFQGAFGDAFSWQNSLQRAAPLDLRPRTTMVKLAMPGGARTPVSVHVALPGDAAEITQANNSVTLR